MLDSGHHSLVVVTPEIKEWNFDVLISDNQILLCGWSNALVAWAITKQMMTYESLDLQKRISMKLHRA